MEGFVIRTGKTGWEDEHDHVIEYSLKLDSYTIEFTSSVIAAYARAAYRLSQEGQTGYKTVFDVAPAYLSVQTPEELRLICCRECKSEVRTLGRKFDWKKESKRLIFGLIGAVIMAVNIKTFVRAGGLYPGGTSMELPC